MKLFLPVMAALLCATPALAAEKRVLRIDGLVATQKDGVIQVQAKGAVQTGGWSKPRLHVLRGDSHTVTVEFLATPPPSGMAVIDALVPVNASAELKSRAAAVRALADENEITTQVLR